ncbi:hypothetical protein K438DRAFT_1939989 [Mycena galopus ATCC 62051]|nr:hypothetical protein K438DRAFT_1939989 [Mycena galopus ATCC 62051]
MGWPSAATTQKARYGYVRRVLVTKVPFHSARARIERGNGLRPTIHVLDICGYTPHCPGQRPARRIRYKSASKFVISKGRFPYFEFFVGAHLAREEEGTVGKEKGRPPAKRISVGNNGNVGVGLEERSDRGSGKKEEEEKGGERKGGREGKRKGRDKHTTKDARCRTCEETSQRREKADTKERRSEEEGWCRESKKDCASAPGDKIEGEGRHRESKNLGLMSAVSSVERPRGRGNVEGPT